MTSIVFEFVNGRVSWIKAKIWWIGLVPGCSPAAASACTTAAATSAANDVGDQVKDRNDNGGNAAHNGHDYTSNSADDSVNATTDS